MSVLEPYQDRLETELNTNFHSTHSGIVLGSSFTCDYSDETQFERIAGWLSKQVALYEKALIEVLGDTD